MSPISNKINLAKAALDEYHRVHNLLSKKGGLVNHKPILDKLNAALKKLGFESIEEASKMIEGKRVYSSEIDTKDLTVTGSCNNCGLCCKSSNCEYYIDALVDSDSGKLIGHCKIHDKKRPLICEQYPLVKHFLTGAVPMACSFSLVKNGREVETRNASILAANS